eukprot:m.183124 g.183124  ORF g.183124 m.183124 type:complete len:114 (-) comp13592_c0_seq10:303-644(-)
MSVFRRASDTIHTLAVCPSVARRQKYPGSAARFSSPHFIMSKRYFSLYSDDFRSSSKSRLWSMANCRFNGADNRTTDEYVPILELIINFELTEGKPSNKLLHQTTEANELKII